MLVFYLKESKIQKLGNLKQENHYCLFTKENTIYSYYILYTFAYNLINPHYNADFLNICLYSAYISYDFFDGSILRY